MFVFNIYQKRRGFLNIMRWVGLRGLGITRTGFGSVEQGVTPTKWQSSLKSHIALERQ